MIKVAIKPECEQFMCLMEKYMKVEEGVAIDEKPF